MVIKPHNAGNIKIAEVTSDQIIIQSGRWTGSYGKYLLSGI
jgi:hypothetical protein